MLTTMAILIRTVRPTYVVVDYKNMPTRRCVISPNPSPKVCRRCLVTDLSHFTCISSTDLDLHVLQCGDATIDSLSTYAAL
jgi:hypothetical protein